MDSFDAAFAVIAQSDSLLFLVRSCSSTLELQVVGDPSYPTPHSSPQERLAGTDRADEHRTCSPCYPREQAATQMTALSEDDRALDGHFKRQVRTANQADSAYSAGFASRNSRLGETSTSALCT